MRRLKKSGKQLYKSGKSSPPFLLGVEVIKTLIQLRLIFIYSVTGKDLGRLRRN